MQAKLYVDLTKQFEKNKQDNKTKNLLNFWKTLALHSSYNNVNKN